MKYLAIFAALISISASSQSTETRKPKDGDLKCAIHVGQKSIREKAPANTPCETYVAETVAVPATLDSKTIKSLK